MSHIELIVLTLCGRPYFKSHMKPGSNTISKNALLTVLDQSGEEG